MERNCDAPQTYVISMRSSSRKELDLSAVGQSRRRKWNGPQEAAGRNVFVFTAAVPSFRKGN
jgi:hypothetical protein